MSAHSIRSQTPNWCSIVHCFNVDSLNHVEVRQKATQCFSHSEGFDILTDPFGWLQHQENSDPGLELARRDRHQLVLAVVFEITILLCSTLTVNQLVS